MSHKDYIYIKDNQKRIRSTAVRSIENIHEVDIKCGEIREVAETIRNSSKYNLVGYYFQSPISVVYDEGQSIDRLYAENVILELNKFGVSPKYGVEFVNIGIPSPIYNYIIKKATEYLNINADHNAYIERNNYTWIGSVSCKRLDLYVMNGNTAIYATKISDLATYLKHNACGYAILEPKLKASSPDNGDITNARASLKWKLGFDFSQFFVNSDVNIASPTVTVDNELKVGLPDTHADESVRALIARIVPTTSE